jgi:mannose-6-phosphate isomerase-like protein (cupin superfamily)
MESEKRPWGIFEILCSRKDFKIKQINVNPNSRLSLQSHKNRAEFWLIIEGAGEVQVNELKFEVQKGSKIEIEKGIKHRISNTGSENLVFIEIQTGSYFGEDDITRFEDDYNRL